MNEWMNFQTFVTSPTGCCLLVGIMWHIKWHYPLEACYDWANMGELTTDSKQPP